MVGVPGRSKGCNTCRKRRVKCDETKPVCQRCVKAGFHCLGYAREVIWRHTSTAPFPSGTELESHLDMEPEQLLTHLTLVKVQDHKERDPMPTEMSLSAFERDFCMSYMFSNFVWRAFGVGWLTQAAEGKLGCLARDASIALAQVTFGRENRQTHIEIKGRSTYGNCLRTLAGELGKGMPALAKGGQDLIVPILVLIMQAAATADRAGSISHLKGIARLLHICGPEAFQRQPLLNAFEACRATMTVAGLGCRQRLFLEEATWRTGPWALDPGAKSSQSHLLDILVTVPGMLNDHAKLEVMMNEELPYSNSPESTSSLPPGLSTSPSSAPSVAASTIDPFILHDSILTRVSTQLETLYRWRWRWQGAHGSEVTVDNTDLEMDVDRGILRFTRFGAAAEIMLYNAVLVWLMALLWKLEPLRGGEIVKRCADDAMAAVTEDPNTSPSNRSRLSPTTCFHPLQSPGSAMSIRDPAVEICRAFEWQSRHHSSTANNDLNCLYLFPVGIAMNVLNEEQEGSEWVMNLLDKSPVTRPYGGYGATPAGSGQAAPKTQPQTPGTASRPRTGRNVAGFRLYMTKEALHPDEAWVNSGYEMNFENVNAGFRGPRTVTV